MTESIKPRVVFSRCLGFDACRYNGQTIHDDTVETLVPFVEAITVCPEVAIGLGVPRSPIRLIEEKDEIALFQPATGRDATSKMAEFANQFLGGLTEIDGFVLKSRSPSCGPSQVKVYNSRNPNAGHRKGTGAFAQAVVERFRESAIEDEGRLQNFDIRQHFLTKLYASARFRAAASRRRMNHLVAFHAQHKFLLMAYNQTAMRELGRVIANAKRLSIDEVAHTYRRGLMNALAKAPRRTSAINVLLHGFGYVSDKLSPGEKSFFLDALERYRARQIPLSVPASLVRSWSIRFDVEYLLDQTCFEPFPQELVSVLDSGKGRSAS